MAKLKVMIDAGHGAGRQHNRGSVCSNEGDNAFYYSLVLKTELEKYEGVTVGMTRKKVTDDPSLAQRARMGNGYDLFLSEHSNAATASVRGTEIFDSVERRNKTLANAICSATAKAFGHNNRGVKYKEGSRKGYNYYGVLRFNGAKSAMIIENGFHTNPQDCSYFKNNHQELARIQANEIAYHYGLKKKIKEEPKLTKLEVANMIKDIMRPSRKDENDEHWAKESYDNLVNKGVNIEEKRFDDAVKRGEMFAMLDRITDMD